MLQIVKKPTYGITIIIIIIIIIIINNNNNNNNNECTKPHSIMAKPHFKLMSQPF